MVHGADEVRGEDEAALQHRNDQQALGLAGRDLPGEVRDAVGDLGFRKQDTDAVTLNDLFCHGDAIEPISEAWAKRISRFFAVSGGDATRVTKLVISPGFRGLAPASSVQV